MTYSCNQCGHSLTYPGQCANCNNMNLSRAMRHMFLYVPTRGPRSKKPIEAFVENCPDGIDPRSYENPYMYPSDEVDTLRKKYPDAGWVIAGFNTKNWPDTTEFVTIDLDVGNDHKKTTDIDIDELIENTPDYMTVWRTPSGGAHMTFFINDHLREAYDTPEGVDLVGSEFKTLVGNPWYMDGYEMVQVGDNPKARLDFYLEDGTVNEELGFEIFKPKEKSHIHEIDFAPADEAPDEIPYCMRVLLKSREGEIELPYNNKWREYTHLGQLCVANGYEKEESLKLFEDHPPDGDPKKFDANITANQLERLYQKKESLHPPTTALLDNGININQCECPAHKQYGKKGENSRLYDVLPTDEEGEPVVADNPLFEYDVNTDMIQISTARAGKSWAVCRCIAAAYEAGFEGHVLFLGPTHDETKATVNKLHRMSHGRFTIARLIGEQAASELGISTSGDYYPREKPLTPDEAARIPEHYNAYQALVEGAEQADVVVTVPELIALVGEYDILACCEESAMRKLQAREFSLLSFTKRHFSNPDVSMPILKKQAAFRNQLAKIQALQRKSDAHRAIERACKAYLRVCRLIREWEFGSWSSIHNQQEHIQKSIHRLLDVDKTGFDPGFTRRNTNPRIAIEVFGVVHFDGVLQYGKVGINPNTDRLFTDDIKLSAVSERHQEVFVIDENATMWFAGFNLPAIRDTLEMLGHEPPEAHAFKAPDWITDTSTIYRYTGGDNPSEQTGQMRELFDELHAARGQVSGVATVGSSERAARHSLTTPKCWLPSPADTIEHTRDMMGSNTGTQMKVPVTSRFCTGVDLPEAQYQVVEHAFYATPFEDYHAEATGNETLAIGAKLSALQNATLRAANTKTEGTDATPHIIPDKHAPDVMFEIFDAFGLEVKEIDDLTELKKEIVKMLDTHESVTIEGDRITRKESSQSLIGPWNTDEFATIG